MALTNSVYLYKKKAVDFFFYNNLSFIKTCSVGDVLTIYYFIIFGKKKKTFTFTGILLFKKKNSFGLENCIDSEIIRLSFPYFSPSIIGIFKSDKYNFRSNRYKLRLKEKLSLTALNVNFISDFFNVNFDMPRLVLDNFFGFFKISSFYKKKFKKIKKKFRY